MTLPVGIDAMSLYAGRAFLDVGDLAVARGLDPKRFTNLLMRRKSLALPFEDPVSFAVNAAQPLIANMPEDVKDRIRLLIISSESGMDYGKSMGAYVHQALGLNSRCRQFEIKQACYGGTAALRMAVNWVGGEGAMIKGGGLALVISTDLARPVRHSYAEPSQGSAAMALLVAAEPKLLTIDPGASGVHTFEVPDACRPRPDVETGDADLSLHSYITCLEHSFAAYREAVDNTDFLTAFDQLAFHTPFGGMVKGAHRTLMRKLGHIDPAAITQDFEARLMPSLGYCQQVGNIYSGTLFLALVGALEHASDGARIGLFSYGSGCCSEFYSGQVVSKARHQSDQATVADSLAGRKRLSVPEYDKLLDDAPILDGVRDLSVGPDVAGGVARDLFDQSYRGRDLLILSRIEGHQRIYEWC